MTELRKIVLIGTSHIYQEWRIRCQSEDAQAFQRLLMKECRQYGIRTVAEESNEQSLKKTQGLWEERKQCLKERKASGTHSEDLENKLKECEKALTWHKKGMSIPQRVAEELTLKHLFCEPDNEQRDSRKIKDEMVIEIERDFKRSISAEEADRQIRESRTKREDYWLEQLQRKVAESEYPVLFICGAEHVDTFSKLLEENDFNVTCICKDWKPSIPNS